MHCFDKKLTKEVLKLMNSVRVKSNFNEFNMKEKLIFFIPSIIGVILFLLPLNYDGKINIGVGYLAELFKNNVGYLLPTIVTIIVFI